MIVTAALAWWNEPTWALDRLVRSLEGVADRLVAVDGRWANMPGRGLLSPDDEACAIRDAASAAGLDLVLSRKAKRWTQVEKRNHLMQLAAAGSDWVLVVDGDTFVGRCDTAAFRAALEHAAEDVALIEVVNVGTMIRSRWPRRRRLVYRAAAGPRVVTAHNGYRSSVGRWLNGDPEHVELEPAVDAAGHLQLIHDIDSRGRERRGQQSDYYAARAGAGEEAWATV